MKEMTEYWDERSAIFDDMIEKVYKQTHIDTIDSVNHYLKPTDNVLDFACGTCIISAGMAGHVAKVRAIDISEKMVELGRTRIEKLGIGNVELSQCGLFDESLEPGSFDAVVAANVLCYLEHWDREMERIRSLLKPGGLFLSATDCLGQQITGEGVRKFIKMHTGKMPYEAFFRMKGLEKKIAGSGFTILESKNLHPAPPNLFVAARKNG